MADLGWDLARLPWPTSRLAVRCVRASVYMERQNDTLLGWKTCFLRFEGGLFPRRRPSSSSSPWATFPLRTSGWVACVLANDASHERAATYRTSHGARRRYPGDTRTLALSDTPSRTYAGTFRPNRDSATRYETRTGLEIGQYQVPIYFHQVTRYPLTRCSINR